MPTLYDEALLDEPAVAHDEALLDEPAVAPEHFALLDEPAVAHVQLHRIALRVRRAQTDKPPRKYAAED